KRSISVGHVVRSVQDADQSHFGFSHEVLNIELTFGGFQWGEEEPNVGIALHTRGPREVGLRADFAGVLCTNTVIGKTGHRERSPEKRILRTRIPRARDHGGYGEVDQ